MTAYYSGGVGIGPASAPAPASAPIKPKPAPSTPRNPPQPPYNDGLIVAFGPHNLPDEPPNKWFNHPAALPLTPGSLPIASAGNYQDGIYAISGDEHGMFAGAQLKTITFSGRLEPPDYYVSDTQVSRIAEYASGQFNPMALDTVRDGNGVLRIVAAGELGGPVDVNAQITIMQNLASRSGMTNLFPGSQQPATPPTIVGGTDVVMQDGGIAPPGFWWHEPHVFALMLEAACEQGEIIRLTIGDQYGFNRLVTVRTFSWRYEDPDPDVILYDISLREYRTRTLPSGPVTHAKPASRPRSYVTRAGDTLHTIAHLEFGDANKWRTIAQYNLSALQKLWIYSDQHAVAPNYVPPGESAGTRTPVPTRGPKNIVRHQVGKIRHLGQGVGPDLYLRQGVKLSLVAAPSGSKKK